MDGFDLSPEHEMLRDSVAKIVSGFGHRYFRESVRTGERLGALWAALGDAGFLGVYLPEAYGGGGMGITELSIVAEEAAAGGCPLALLPASSATVGEILARFGTPGQCERWLPDVATGKIILALAVTEPDAGLNTRNLSTRATRTSDGWLLNGTKHYISAAREAEAIMVVARTEEPQDAGTGGGLSIFMVTQDVDGMSMAPIDVDIVSPETQYTVFLDDVRIPHEALVGVAGNGLRQLFVGLNPERILSASLSIGIGRYAVSKGASYAADRNVWGVPIAQHQGVSHPLAAAKIQLDLASLMRDKAAWQHDSGRPAGEASNMAKYAAAEAALDALDASMQAHGGNGMATEYGLADLWGQARLMKIAPVSQEMILNYISERSLGMPRSY